MRTTATPQFSLICGPVCTALDSSTFSQLQGELSIAHLLVTDLTSMYIAGALCQALNYVLGIIDLFNSLSSSEALLLLLLYTRRLRHGEGQSHSHCHAASR